MILFLYFISIVASFGIEGSVRPSSITKILAGSKHLYGKSESKGHAKSSKPHSYSTDDVVDTYGVGSGTNDGVEVSNGIFRDASNSVLKYFHRGERKIKEKLDNVANDVEDGGKKVLVKSLNFLKENGEGAINVTVDVAGNVSETAIDGGLKTLEVIGVNSEVIGNIRNSSDDAIVGVEDLTKEVTKNIVNGGVEVLNKTGVTFIGDTANTFRNVVDSESDALEKSVPGIVSGAFKGDLKQVKSASINLVSNTVENGKMAFDGVANTLGNGAKNLGTGVVHTSIDTVENLVHKGLNTTMKVAKKHGANEKVVDEIGNAIGGATHEVAKKSKIITEEVIGRGIDVYKNRYTASVDRVAKVAKFALDRAGR